MSTVRGESHGGRGVFMLTEEQIPEVTAPKRYLSPANRVHHTNGSSFHRRNRVGARCSPAPQCRAAESF